MYTNIFYDPLCFWFWFNLWILLFMIRNFNKYIVDILMSVVKHHCFFFGYCVLRCVLTNFFNYLLFSLLQKFKILVFLFINSCCRNFVHILLTLLLGIYREYTQNNSILGTYNKYTIFEIYVCLSWVISESAWQILMGLFTGD